MTSKIDEDMLAAMMRRMAWERAKGEFYSALATFYGSDPRFASAYKAIGKFVREVESNGWMDTVVLYHD